MAERSGKYRKMPSPRSFSGRRVLFHFVLLFLVPVCVFSAFGEDYFWAPAGRGGGVAELEALFDQKESYRNPGAVCLHIADVIRREAKETPEARRLLLKIGFFFENFDIGTLSPEEQWHFLRSKALFYHLEDDEEKMLETLGRFPLAPPYVIDDFHGALGVKRNSVSAILNGSFERGLVFRPVRVFLSSLDVFSWTERLGGIFVLPFFALNANPRCFGYWVWLVLVIVFAVAALYGVGKAMKTMIAGFKASATSRKSRVPRAE